MSVSALVSPSTSEKRQRILVVDDEPEMVTVIEGALRRRGYDVTQEHTADAAWERLEREDFDVVVTDINMRGMNGIELTKRSAENRHDVPVIVITAFGSMETATAVLRAGAYDFITKPFDIDQLVVACERAIQNRRLREEVKRLRAEVGRSKPISELHGDSSAMQKVHETIARVADTDATVLITGESGTGKELVARALHKRSKRNAHPFIVVNCSSSPERAFLDQGAGTLFLDEIGEMPLTTQANLLHALEARTLRPAQAGEASFDMRIIAGTNRDLESLVEAGQFREDLYYRVNIVNLALPPLRARGGDVLALAQQFVTRYAEPMGKKVHGISSAVGERLLAYSWPGNVRELQNCIERALALARFDEVTVEDLPPKVRDYNPSFVVVATEDPTDLVTMEEVERRYVGRVMEAVAQNKTQAAKVLGFDRTTLYRKLERYKLGGAQGTASKE